MNNDKTKTPGAMVLVPREPTVEMYDAAMSAVSTPGEMPIVANAYNMNSACFRARYQAAISVADQPPAVGGEPEVVGYQCRQSATEKFFLHEYPHYWQHLPLVRLDDHRVRITSLLAENALLQKQLGDRWKDIEALQANGEKLESRIAQLEAAKGDPVGSFDKHMEFMQENIQLKARIAELEASQGEPFGHMYYPEDRPEDEFFIQGDTPPPNVFDRTPDAFGEIWAAYPLYRQAKPATAKLEMADVVKAHMEIPYCPVLTSNQCHALAMKLNAKLNGGAQ